MNPHQEPQGLSATGEADSSHRATTRSSRSDSPEWPARAACATVDKAVFFPSYDAPPGYCRGCGNPVEFPVTGRPRAWCSSVCKTRHRRNKGKRYAAALLICADCPVKAQCLAEATARGELNGVWGGKVFDRPTPAEMAAVVRAERPKPTGPNRVLVLLSEWRNPQASGTTCPQDDTATVDA